MHEPATGEVVEVAEIDCLAAGLQAASQTLRPLLPAVEDGDDFKTVASQPVRNYVRCPLHDQFSRARDSARTAQIRQLGEMLDSLEQDGSDSTGGLGIVARDI